MYFQDQSKEKVSRLWCFEPTNQDDEEKRVKVKGYMTYERCTVPDVRHDPYFLTFFVLGRTFSNV